MGVFLRRDLYPDFCVMGGQVEWIKTKTFSIKDFRDSSFSRRVDKVSGTLFSSPQPVSP